MLPSTHARRCQMFLLVDLSGGRKSDLTRPMGPPGGGLGREFPFISGNFRLVKYYSVWSDRFG